MSRKEFLERQYEIQMNALTKSKTHADAVVHAYLLKRVTAELCGEPVPEDYRIRNVVRAENGQFFLIASDKTFEDIFETMVFTCNEYGKHVDYTNPVDEAQFENYGKMWMGHQDIAKKWGEKVS